LKRYDELDSLRGIAAFSVLIAHSIIITMFLKNLFENSPLKILEWGHPAVIMFFMLSGFVLSLPYINNKSQKYSKFLLKRICRIYIPYFVAISLGILLRISFNNGVVNGLWNTPITWSIISKHYLMLVQFNQNSFDPVVWSLVHEMRISIIFPIIMFIIMKYNWKICLIIGFGLSVLGIVLLHVFPNGDPRTNYFVSIHYCLMFIIGALMAKNLVRVKKFFQFQSFLFKIIFLLCGICLYYGGYEFRLVLGHEYSADWITTVGASIIIISALSFNKLSKTLKVRVLLFLGKISYSLYLFHLMVFLSLENIWNGVLSPFEIWIISTTVSICLATVIYHIIEKPSINLGRIITNRKLSKNNSNIKRVV
jgi:peptidoglycan/LPS O-acetylase OafA/YrhL